MTGQPEHLTYVKIGSCGLHACCISPFAIPPVTSITSAEGPGNYGEVSPHAVAGVTLPGAPCPEVRYLRPPRREAPMTHPALINTKFLRIYCASNVGAYGIWANTSFGNKKRGVSVPPMCRNRSAKVRDGHTPRSNPRPITVSQRANRGMARCGAR